MTAFMEQANFSVPMDELRFFILATGKYRPSLTQKAPHLAVRGLAVNSGQS